MYLLQTSRDAEDKLEQTMLAREAEDAALKKSKAPAVEQCLSAKQVSCVLLKLERLCEQQVQGHYLAAWADRKAQASLLQLCHHKSYCYGSIRRPQIL